MNGKMIEQFICHARGTKTGSLYAMPEGNIHTVPNVLRIATGSACNNFSEEIIVQKQKSSYFRFCEVNR